MIFGEIASGLTMWDRVAKFWKARKDTRPETVATRLVRLLESHGVHRNQIPRFIGHSLTVADVQSDESLLQNLTEDMLDDICARLAVRREWLDGADSQIYPYHNFYKYPERFSDFLDTLRENNPDGEIAGVLIAPERDDDNADALIILEVN